MSELKAVNFTIVPDAASAPDRPGTPGGWLRRLVVHPLDRVRRVLGGIDGVLELAVEVAPLDDLDRVGRLPEQPADRGP